MTCDAKVLMAPWFATYSRDTMVGECGKDMNHSDNHESNETLVLDGNGEVTERLPTKVTWMEEDRRTYRGPLEFCEVTMGCVCPNGHRGECAT